jgi:hypothetical protein
MAVKSLVNDEAEMLGVDPDEPVVELELELGLEAEPELELELDDELPQAAMPRLALTASAASTALLLSKCTFNSPPPYAQVTVAHRCAGEPEPHIGDLVRNHKFRTMNEALISAEPTLMNGKWRSAGSPGRYSAAKR